MVNADAVERLYGLAVIECKEGMTSTKIRETVERIVRENRFVFFIDSGLEQGEYVNVLMEKFSDCFFYPKLAEKFGIPTKREQIPPLERGVKQVKVEKTKTKVWIPSLRRPRFEPGATYASLTGQVRGEDLAHLSELNSDTEMC